MIKVIRRTDLKEKKYGIIKINIYYYNNATEDVLKKKQCKYNLYYICMTQLFYKGKK